MEEEEFTLNAFMSINKQTSDSVNQKKTKKKKQKGQQNSLNNINQQLKQQNINDLSQFSESLERYLKKSFLKCISKKERKEMKKTLLQEIKNAQQIGNINERDWDNQTIPLLNRELIEMKLFNDVNAITQPIKITEQSSKIADLLVKHIKEVIINSNLSEIQEEDKNENLDFGQEQQNIEQIQVQQKDILSKNDPLENDQQKEIFQLKMNPNQMDVEQNEDNSQFDEDDFDVERMKIPVVGTSNKLEKDYLRLTNYPKADEVRSHETLVNSFEFIKKKYINKSEDYQYFQSQFRSLRQDLLVQNINNDFTMKVLEENARICLENYDIQEYSRCLGQLIWMYKELPDLTNTAYQEFIYYRLIQNIFEDKKDNLLACLQEINQDKILLSEEFEKAMKFQHAISMGNIKGFFSLYNKTKDHGKYLMDLQIKRWKVWGIKIFCKTYGPQTISVSLFQSIFCFSSIEETINELKQLNCVLDENNEKVLIKDTLTQIEQLKY